MLQNIYPTDKVFTHTVAVKMEANKYRYVFNTESNLLNVNLIGVIARKASDAFNSKSYNGEALANGNVFNAAFLRIKKGNTDVHERLPLPIIEAATQQNPGVGFPLALNNINITDSGIDLAAGISITAGEVIELVFVYKKFDSN